MFFNNPLTKSVGWDELTNEESLIKNPIQLTVFFIFKGVCTVSKKNILVLSFLLVFAILSMACVIIIQDGDELQTKRDTAAWQCPGGPNLSNFERVNNCTNQSNHGNIEAGTLVVAERDGFSLLSRLGYTRVRAQVTVSDPYTQSCFRLPERIYWVKTSDLEHVK